MKLQHIHLCLFTTEKLTCKNRPFRQQILKSRLYINFPIFCFGKLSSNCFLWYRSEWLGQVRYRHSKGCQVCECSVHTLENALLDSTETDYSTKWWNRREYSGKYSGAVHTLFNQHSLCYCFILLNCLLSWSWLPGTRSSSWNSNIAKDVAADRIIKKWSWCAVLSTAGGEAKGESGQAAYGED